MKEIKLNKLKETIYYDKCDNGLEIYMWVKNNSNYYYATFNTRFGSIDTKFKIKDKEYNVNNGIAHYLEHINFNESDNTTPDDYYNIKGTSTNAFTTYDLTSYEIYGSSDILGDTLHLIDFVQDRYFTEDIIEGERNIILEEVKMDNNNPGQKMYYETQKSIYSKNKRRNEITGSEKDISKINKNELELVYDTFYQPSNMFLIITGNFNPYEISMAIKENQNKKKIKKIHFTKIYDKEDAKVNKENTEISDNIEIPKLSLAYKMSRRKFKEFNDLYLKIYLDLIINANFGPTSNLKEDLMEKELIYTLTYSINIDNDNVVIELDSETKYPLELIKILKEDMSKLVLTEEKLKRRIKCSIAYLISGLDDIEFVNSLIQNDIIKYNKINNNIYDIYQSLTLDEAKKIIKHIDLNNCSVVIMNKNKD
ncbi:MAG: insulinase family protein [Bacilli bacterium]|nr:insulinase family protein [Bacilli bacterium]